MISNFLTKNIPAQLHRCKKFLVSTIMVWQVNQTQSQHPILHPITAAVFRSTLMRSSVFSNLSC